MGDRMGKPTAKCNKIINNYFIFYPAWASAALSSERFSPPEPGRQGQVIN